ncbi:hypothetical protein BDV95DRAFT_490561 [Massariosphaeria phaeospora]|uniref:Required for respiratory growth protein 9, mitochondrial n=1 Tax=Massariosphaeria phaeospora TaxID=100035 RepID=A0A7C8MH30_9PLEO|nr:hypothetical protein BDV95DRAFT_490561 [Massariosphaeria phaeospora]
MNCHACTQRTLRLFVRSFTGTESLLLLPRSAPRRSQSTAQFSAAAARSFQRREDPTETAPEGFPKIIYTATEYAGTNKGREPWQIQKAALKEKLGGAAWSPRKKLSPDTMEGIRHLHQTQPERFTTPVLAQHFQVSPDAIRRILKSTWQPSDEEQEERLRRWDKRGETIWSNLVELGVKPPKRWREMGVGRVTGGGLPKWKSQERNMVAVNDSFNEDIIPTVDSSGQSSSLQGEMIPLSERI